MRCPLVFRSDLENFVFKLNTSVPKYKIKQMSKKQLYAIWYSTMKKESK